MSSYRAAIDLTTCAIHRRARCYRGLIAAVLASCTAGLLSAAFLQRSSPLSGLLLLFPLCGFYFYLDTLLVHRWRLGLLTMWAKREIDLRAFSDTITMNPLIPKQTLRGMLETLPQPGEIQAERKLSEKTREAVADAVATIERCHCDGIACRTAAHTVAAGSMIAAILTLSWQPLWGAGALLLTPVMQETFWRWRLKGFRERTLSYRQEASFDRQKYQELAASLQWESVPASARDKILSPLR